MYGLIYLLAKYVLLQIFDISLAIQNINSTQISKNDFLMSIFSLLFKVGYIILILTGYKHGHVKIGYKPLKSKVLNNIKDFLFILLFFMGILISCYNIHCYNNDLPADKGVGITVLLVLCINFLFIMYIRFGK